jgi:hypothetical protein
VTCPPNRAMNGARSAKIVRPAEVPLVAILAATEAEQMRGVWQCCLRHDKDRMLKGASGG